VGVGLKGKKLKVGGGGEELGRGKVGCFNYSANFVMRNREYGSLGQTHHVVH